MKMTLIFGDEMKCGYDDILKNEKCPYYDREHPYYENIIYKNFDNLIDPNFRKIIRDNDFLIRPFCDKKQFYTNIFIECELKFENYFLNEKIQLSVNPFMDLIMSLYNFNFQKTY